MFRISRFVVGRLAVGVVASFVLALCGSEASAQYYYAPAMYAPAPVAVYAAPRRVTTYYAPAYVAPVVAPVYASPYAQTAYMAPAPYAAYPAYGGPIPVTSYYGSPYSYSSFYPPAPAVVATGVPVYGPAAVVRSKVYYRGQPIRNTLRAVTP